MLTREEKKKLREHSKERKEKNLILQDSLGREIALILAKGDDFPWQFGKIEPMEHFAEFEDTFNEALRYQNKTEEALDQNQDKKYDHFKEKEFEVYDRINDLGLKIWSKRTNENNNYSTVNICGTNSEWK